MALYGSISALTSLSDKNNGDVRKSDGIETAGNRIYEEVA